MNHIEGKLVYNTFTRTLLNDGGEVIAENINKATARRFAACWNACLKISIEDLETKDNFLSHMQELDQRTADYDRALELAEKIGEDRDKERAIKEELVRALEKLLFIVGQTSNSFEALIAKAEGDSK